MRMPPELRSLCRAYTEESVRWMAGIAQHGTTESARVAAITALWERGWGKPPQSHTGADGEGSIQVIVRHIINGHDAPATIEHSPIVSVSDDTDR